ncbi:hypothetical protein [Fuscovulum ytuae]|uniref:Uncharacterized protein n=1 Tax=Fuscovulum ytuae TaxID=3042299 RepID=A0ABY8Q6J6_9RHOB|nr:hypothetical protein [Fuscovulum sp. YMD61]WGV16483.1 hypothetical protein QF092_01310 [Fuscovulum sp. YMD61]
MANKGTEKLDREEPLQGKDLLCFKLYVENLFVEPALSDWAAARLLHQNQLIRNFSWAAAQALEKSIKAALLLNWRSANFGHSFSNHFGKLLTLRNAAWPKTLPRTFPCFDWFLGEVESFETSLARFEKNGLPDSRYMLGDVHVMPDDLFRLDFLMGHILLHCCDVEADSPKTPIVPKIETHQNAALTLIDYFIRKLEWNPNKQTLLNSFTAHNYALASWSKSNDIKLICSTSLGRDDTSLNHSWRAQRYLEAHTKKIKFK